MADNIFRHARYAFRSGTLNNWQNTNPILEKGEPAVVTNGIDGEWLKIGDGVTPFNSLEWKKGPRGEKGEPGAVKMKRVEFQNGAELTAEDNTEYTAIEPITNVVITYPKTDFICSFNFTLAESGNVTIDLPESKYIGTAPTFANGETCELNIKNGVVVGGLVE